MARRKLELQLYGGFFCRWSDGEPVDLRGMKHRALIAILATAANGTHTRSWIQETLWMLSGEELGRASLRRALSDIRKLFGADFDLLFSTSNADVTLNLDHVELTGDPSDGPFLDGISIPEPGFRTWLEQKRRDQPRESSALFLANRSRIAPKVAVLPFVPRQRSEDEMHLADLLAMEISRSLSRSRLIDVISHLSSRKLNTRSMDLSDIQQKLGFDYVAYGTVQLNDGAFRVEVDLAEATTGRIASTDVLTGNLADLLSGQTKSIEEAASRIGHGIVAASVELARSRPLPDIESHALLMSAVSLMHGQDRSGFLQAQAYLDELISRAPNYSVLHAWLAKWFVLASHQGWTSAEDARRNAVSSAARALDTDPKCAFSLAVDGMVHSDDPKDEAVVTDRFEQSVQLDPNNALAWLLYSRQHMFSGNGDLAVAYADRACMLSPFDPHQYFFDLLRACAKSVCGEYEDALELADSSLKANGRHISTHRVKTIALAMMERDAEARVAADELLRWEPGLTIKSYLENHPAGGDRTMTQQWAGALRRAGVPEA